MSITPGTTWTLRDAGTTNMSWRSIAWSPALSRFVAVGAPVGSAVCKIMTSADGINWTTVNSPVNGSGSQMKWYRVAWSVAAGLFVAVGAPVTASSDLGRVMTSADGTTWTLRATASTGAQVIQWNNVFYVPSLALWVAVGGQISGTLALTNLIMTSPDAITWTMQTAPAASPSDIVWNGLGWSPALGLLVATGASPTSAAGTHIMTSPDGVTWTGRTSAADSGGNFLEVIWSDALALFITTSSVAATNSVMTSPDGVTWTAQTLSVSTQWYSLVWIPVFGEILSLGFGTVTGGTNQQLTSFNGTSWAIGNINGISPANQFWRAMAYAQELLRVVAVANTLSGSGAIITSDGLLTPTTGLTIATATGGGGYCDVSEATLAAGQYLTDDALVKMSENAKFAAVRSEMIFMGYYAHGATIPIPLSPVDGYVYSRSELIFEWTPYSTRGPDAHFVNGQAAAPWIGNGLKLGQPANLYWMQFDIDDASGKVSTLVSYFAQGVVPETITNDGVLKVFAICQRASVSVPN